MPALVRMVGAAAVLAAAVGAWWFLRNDARGPQRGADSASPANADPDPAQGAHAKRRAPVENTEPSLPANLAAFADLDAERDVHGIVVDRDDHPVAAARISAHPFDVYRWSF